ncbi:hypothetical protein OUZ56_002585 [Daphnia magna]|uniref:Uncharacterized protein n=1 Tax=Daphnia magna TaxID=35525 RepID=A0ABR0A651_9CRUS|nr:hypothetical protein OUZ56_002585 [Daphnia magna]
MGNRKRATRTHTEKATVKGGSNLENTQGFRDSAHEEKIKTLFGAVSAANAAPGKSIMQVE